MAPKPSCCIRFCCCCFSSSSSSDEKRQDPTSAGRRSPPSAIETPSVDSKRTEAPKCEIEPVEPNPCNVSGLARQSDKAPASASPNILQKSDQDENVNVNKNVSGDPAYNETPPTASIEESKYYMHAKASTSVPSNAVPAPSPSDKAPASASLNILQKSDQDESVNVNKNVSGYNETDPPTASSEASKDDIPAKALTSVPSNAVPASSQSFSVPQKSEGANVNINQNVSGAPRCSTGSTPSSSSPTQPTKSGLLKAIQDQVEGKGVDVNLDELMDHISNLLKLREQEMQLRDKKASTTRKFSWPEGFKKLNAILSWGTDLKNLTGLLSSGLDFASKLKEIKTLLEGIGRASFATAGLLVVAYALERFDELSTNKEKCWDLIKEMSYVGSVVQRLNDSPKGTQEDVIEQTTLLIVEGAIMCCSQIASSGWNKFFLSSKNKTDLSEIRQKLNFKYMQINLEIGFRLLTAIESRGMSPLSKKYPKDAVGIDEPIKAVLSLLEIESDQKAVTVILHGFGGMGKTTLADAVFSHVGGCRYSHVQLFENIDSKPNVVELQKKILKDLMGPEEPVPDIRKYEDGQRELVERLEKINAFIYIDNVLERDALTELLPQDMSTAKKVRLLLTARDEDVKKACPRPCTEPKIYKLEGIQHQEALIILQREIKNGINESQFNSIIDTCGGIPLMLTLAAPFIGRANNKKEAYSTLVLQKNKWPREDFKRMWMRYAFAYDALAPHKCQEPFLDICSYFKGWVWETVEDIVGKDKLEMLESRALVTRTTNGVASVHDVILKLARKKSEEESQGKQVRLSFTSARELTEFLQAEGAKGIKGIWLSDNKDVLRISATTLDLMSESLRVLQLGKLANVEGKCTETFKELVFFEVKQLPFQDVSKLKQLRYLSYEPNEPNDLKLSKMPSSLRHMELDGRSHGHAFQISSNALQQLEHLRILRLVNFENLENLPEKLGHQVEGLHELSLSSCRSITKLPDSISNLQSLQILKMDGCQKLTELPVDFGSLSSLRELHLDRCLHLKALPDSAEKLSSLTLLNLQDCSVSNLPPCLGNLTRLVELNLENCFLLKSIPEGIGELKLLRALYVSWCITLTELPDGFCNLSFLTHLSFKSCRNLEKLPDRFGQLASLKVLSFRDCESLQKLPEGFGQLKNLEVLDLGECQNLEELCNDFHCLSSLQNLDLSQCDRLEGKSMDHVVKMNRLQLIVRIEESEELVKRWAELIERDGDAVSRSLTVISGQDFSISRVEKENIEKNLLSELDGLLTNGRREKFHLSDLPANTLILVMWEFPSFIEEMIDDELQIKIIYIGPHFDKFSTKVKDNIFVVHVPTARAKEMLEKVHLTLDIARTDDLSAYLHIDRRMVGDGQRDEYRPCWRLLTYTELEEFLVCNCNRYLRLKQLADEEDEESNIGLLRELFAPQGDETTPVFQKNESSQQHPTAKTTCGVDKLEGKTILLEIRPPDSFDHDIRLPSLKEMYLREKDRLNFEIISIPLVKPITEEEPDEFGLFSDFTRGVSGVFDVYKQFSREVPWLVLQNQWMTITTAVQYFLGKQCTTGWEEIEKCEKWYPTINWIIDPKGRITIYPPRDMMDRGEAFKVLSNYLESESYQVRWGVNASLTPLGKIEEVRKKEWEQLKNMSTLEFLFNHLKSVQVKKLMFQGKFICLYSCVEQITCSMEQFRDSIHFIHCSLMHEVRVLRLASIISKKYYPLENTTEMEGTSLLKLSRHERVSFMMRLHHLEEEINVMDESDKHLCELKSLLDSVVTFFDEGGNSVAAITRRDVESIFLSDRKDRAERLIKTMMKDFERHDEDSLIKKMQTVSAATVEQQSVDVDFDALRDYISELWVVQLYQLFKFKKEGKKRSPPRVTWPTSRGFCRLKNLLSEGANDDWVKDVISRHSEEDACHTIIKSVLKDIEEAEWAVAGLLAVANLLERMETVPNDHRIQWLFVVDEMFRLAQYCKQFNQKDELWRRMKCGAIAVILIYSIDCCWLVDWSKFGFRGYKDCDWLEYAEYKLRKEGDTLDQTMIEDLDNESGSLSNLECYSWGFRLWPQREDEGEPSSVHESSASFPKAGSTGSTGEEE